MENNINNRHRIPLIISFCIVLIGLVLCANYFFVPEVGAANIVANVALVLTFLTTIWYIIKGYTLTSNASLGVPLFMYAACVIIMVSTATVSIDVATPFVTASFCTLIVYPMVIAFNQHRFKLCITLFGVMLLSELATSACVYFLYGPDGVIAGGSLTASLNNVHIFVRSFMTSALALCYVARHMRTHK